MHVFGTGWRGGEWMRGLGFTNTVSVFGLRWCRWGVCLEQGLEEWGGVMSV